MATQLQEMEMVRQKVYNLEQTQIAIKQRYSQSTAGPLILAYFAKCLLQV